MTDGTVGIRTIIRPRGNHRDEQDHTRSRPQARPSLVTYNCAATSYLEFPHAIVAAQIALSVSPERPSVCPWSAALLYLVNACIRKGAGQIVTLTNLTNRSDMCPFGNVSESVPSKTRVRYG